MNIYVAPASMVEDDGMITMYEDDVGEPPAMSAMSRTCWRKEHQDLANALTPIV